MLIIPDSKFHLDSNLPYSFSDSRNFVFSLLFQENATPWWIWKEVFLRQKLAKTFTKKKGTKRIWIQAVSVGEVSSISKLLNQLSNEQNTEIILSGTTSTGLSLAEEKFGHLVSGIGPFSIGLVPLLEQGLKRINPDVIVMVDSELWPEHFYQAQRREIPIYINARLSDRSFTRLNNLKCFHSLLFPKNLTIITASERQCRRWAKLGLLENQIHTSGNLKIDAVSREYFGPKNRQELVEEFGFDQESMILAGISTWKGEENYWLKSCKL